MSLKGRDFLTLKDFTGQEIVDMVNLGIDLKAKLKAGIPTPVLEGKSLGMIFQKSSTRTRVSFEVGMYQLGGQALFLSTNDLQIGRGEPIKDTARVLSRYVDGIMIRTYSHAEVEELAEYADVPVINGLTDDYHPTQVIADLITIQEHKGQLKGIKFAYVGDGEIYDPFSDDWRCQSRDGCNRCLSGRLYAKSGNCCAGTAVCSRIRRQRNRYA